MEELVSLLHSLAHPLFGGRSAAHMSPEVLGRVRRLGSLSGPAAAKLLQIYSGTPVVSEILAAMGKPPMSLPELAVLANALAANASDSHRSLALELMKQLDALPELDTELALLCVSGVWDVLAITDSTPDPRLAGILKKLSSQVASADASQFALLASRIDPTLLPTLTSDLAAELPAPTVVKLLAALAAAPAAGTASAADSAALAQALSDAALRVAPALSFADFETAAFALAQLGLGGFLEAGDLEARLGNFPRASAQLLWAMAVHGGSDVAWALAAMQLPSLTSLSDAERALLLEALSAQAIFSKPWEGAAATLLADPSLQAAWSAQTRPKSTKSEALLRLLPEMGEKYHGGSQPSFEVFGCCVVVSVKPPKSGSPLDRKIGQVPTGGADWAKPLEGSGALRGPQHHPGSFALRPASRLRQDPGRRAAEARQLGAVGLQRADAAGLRLEK